MKLKYLAYLGLFLIFSCKNSSEENIQEENLYVSTLFGERGFVFPEFLPSAENEIAYWGVLEDVLSEVRRLNGSNYHSLQSLSENIKQHSDSLTKSIPEALNTQAINSRLMVLKTRADLLFQSAHNEALDTLSIQEAVREMNLAVSNLINRINEKVQKDKIDFQRKENEEAELKKQQRYRDSIMELELADQKRNN